MPHNHCAFSDRQICRLSYKRAFNWFIRVTRPLNRYQIKSLYCRLSFRCNSAEIATNRQIIHVTISERVEKAGVYTGDLVARLWSNWTTVDSLVVLVHRSLKSRDHWTVGRIQRWKRLHCRLSFRYHSTETATNKLVIAVMYRQFSFLNSFQSLRSLLLRLLISVINK
jgi:hypothetical protein